MKLLPVGVDDFKEIIENDYYYVDKTDFIRNLIDDRSKVSIFTRPRRFGKTLALSMLKYYFEGSMGVDGEEQDNGRLFEGLKIMDAGEKYVKHQGQYPVIFLSLKSAKQPDYDMAYGSIVDEIAKEFRRHNRILESDRLLEEEKERYIRLRSRKGSVLEILSGPCLNQPWKPMRIWNLPLLQGALGYRKKAYLQDLTTWTSFQF